MLNLFWVMTNRTMMSTTIESTRDRLQIFIPWLTMVLFLAFAFLLGSVIVLSIIPIYIGNTSVERTRFLQTTVRLSNYTLSMNRAVRKRDVNQLSNTTTHMTLDQARMIMNSSIQSALEEQLKAGDTRDQFYIHIFQMTLYTDDPRNMSVMLDLLIVYTKECIPCSRHRQSIIFKQLCSKNQLSNSIEFLIVYTNLSYTFSDPVIVYSSYIPMENIVLVTRNDGMIDFAQSNNLTNTSATTQLSNGFLATNYTLIVTTTKTNYIATLDQVSTQTSASPNDGPVPLVGATTMYPELVQIIERQTQSSNSSIALNITINHIVVQFWYANSTVQILIDFFIHFSTSCNYQCSNQRSLQLHNQLVNLTNTTIHIQPANLTNGQVNIFKNENYVLYGYSLTTQIIANFTGIISRAIPPALTSLH